MKIRSGFVSNSSSSSFICDVCNEDYTSYEASLEEAEMFKCENGHTVCTAHPGIEIEGEADYPYNVSSKYCPLCSFTILEDCTAVKYLLKELGKTEQQLLVELQNKFKSYKEFKEYLK